MTAQSLSNAIHFEKASHCHIDIIFNWLAESHMRKFWDNSQEHKDDILNFIHGHKQTYYYGTTKYWVGSIYDEPYCFVLTDQILSSEPDLPDLYRQHLSKEGHTISLDFGIGDKDFLGLGLAAPTLRKFTSFYQDQFDSLADTFFIDPDEKNPKAKHVYEKAGFELVGGYQKKTGTFKGQYTHLLVKYLPNKNKQI